MFGASRFLSLAALFLLGFGIMLLILPAVVLLLSLALGPVPDTPFIRTLRADGEIGVGPLVAGAVLLRLARRSLRKRTDLTPVLFLLAGMLLGIAFLVLSFTGWRPSPFLGQLLGGLAVVLVTIVASLWLRIRLAGFPFFSRGRPCFDLLWLVGTTFIAVILLSRVVPLTAAVPPGSATVPGGAPSAGTGAHLPGVTARTVRLTVSGNSPWVDTGLYLQSGWVVRITASGTINNGSIYPRVAVNPPQGQGLVTAGGGCTAALTPQTGFPAPGLPCWSLIGRIGQGRIFGVGSALTLTADQPGELLLGVNNNAFGTSTGGWTVRIVVSHPA